MILLQAEMLELKANPNRLAMGTVIEARLDKNKGPVATLLVTNGSVKSGQSVVAGTSAGRIRLMTDFKGDTIRKAGPSTAVEILGLTEVPEAGDTFNVVKDDKLAKEIAENRKTKLREEVLARNASTTLEQLFSQIQEGETKDLNLIIKGDVTGSIGAIVSSLEKLSNENVRVKIVHTGVGTVNESDVTLAGTTGSIIIGFNVRPTTAVQALAEREIKFSYTDDVCNVVAEKSFSKKYGARNMRRFIQTEIENKLAHAIIFEIKGNISIASVKVVKGEIKVSCL
jgi:translation initiation factor IF-2